MQSFRLPELSLWFVTPGEGKVRRVRFTVQRLLLCLLVVGVLLGASAFVVGDYARVQLLRLKNKAWLVMVQEERDRLLSLNQELEQELRELKGKNGDIASYERGVKAKLEALSSLFKSVGVDIAQKPTERPRAMARLKPDTLPKPKGGIGGRELDCVGRGNEITCSNLSPPGGSSKGLYQKQSLKTKAVVSHSAIDHGITSRSELTAHLEQFVKLAKNIPLAAPAPGMITSGFGYRFSPFHIGMRLHEGVDFSAPIGTPVYATGDGVVLATGYNSSYGNWIDIDHGYGISSRYAHLSKVLVYNGQVIQRGATIGKVGNTGRSTGPHLHYEIRVKGVAKNPRIYFALAEKLAKVLA